MKQIHFITGLPRSGSTLLCNVLNQNPEFYAGSTSPLPALVNTLVNCLSNSPEVQAALIKSEIIEVGRFKSFNRLCAYAGLAPRVHQSANKTIHGPLNVNRRKKLQWILIEVVYHFIRGLKDKKERYESIKQRKGSNTGKVALARDMLKIIYRILKEKKPFYYSHKDKNYKIRSTATPALSGV